MLNNLLACLRFIVKWCRNITKLGINLEEVKYNKAFSVVFTYV